MKEEPNNTNTGCCSTEQEVTSETSYYSVVSTTYARVCILLLALNFCITGYVMLSIVKMQEEAVAPSQQPITETTSSQTTTPTIKTLDKTE
tara:strand:+ start:26434 stop:26706 length:273 start_codon:yes stop_codon:yes gene_type:complete